MNEERDYEKEYNEAITKKEEYLKLLNEANQLILQVKDAIAYQDRRIEQLREPAMTQKWKNDIKMISVFVEKVNQIKEK